MGLYGQALINPLGLYISLLHSLCIYDRESTNYLTIFNWILTIIAYFCIVFE